MIDVGSAAGYLRGVSESAPPEPEEKERERRRLERLLPEAIKRLVEAGYERLSEGPENVKQFVSDLRLPKEALALILAQLDETKTGLYRVVAKEIRDFLEHTNFAEELTKVLTTLSFQIQTEVRFVPNDSRLGMPRPDVKAKVNIKKDRRSEEATPTPESSEGKSRRPSVPSKDPPRARASEPPPSALEEEPSPPAVWDNTPDDAPSPDPKENDYDPDRG